MQMRSVLGAALPFALAVLAMAQGPSAIFTNIQTSPTSLVPGLGGARFATGATTRFDRPYGSPDGNRWIFVGQYSDGASLRDVIVTGGGTTSAGSSSPVVFGQTTPFDGSITYQSFGTQLGITNDGRFAFGADTDAPTTSDNVVVRWNGSGFDLIAREGTQALGQAPGVNYGSTHDGVHILSDGRVGLRSATLQNATTQQVLYYLNGPGAGSVYAQTDVTIPSGQQVAPDQSIDNLTAGRFRSNADGSHAIYHGDLNGPTASDLVVVYDGNVLAQEGTVLAGSGFTSNILNLSSDNGSTQVSATGGNYSFRGSNADTIDWAVVNGAVVAVTDAPIYAGATELFDDAPFSSTFFSTALDNQGNYVIGGTTNSFDGNANAVLVYNNSHVVVREGDAVDIDGNGLFDDNAFISVFNNDDMWLSDAGILYFNADIRDGENQALGQGYFSVSVNPVPEPATLIGLLVGGALLARRGRRQKA